MLTATALLAGFLALAAENENVAPAPPVVQLRLLSPQARLTFHRRIGTSSAFAPAGMESGKPFAGPGAANPHDEFARLCTTPCSTEIRAGSHQLGLSLDGKNVAPVQQTIDLRGSVELEGVIVSRTPLRVAGALLAFGSAVGGFLLGAVVGGRDRTLHLSALGVILIGTPTGIGMALTPDRADVRVR